MKFFPIFRTNRFKKIKMLKIKSINCKCLRSIFISILINLIVAQLNVDCESNLNSEAVDNDDLPNKKRNSDYDTSVFGNTDESFFEFNNRRLQEMIEQNTKHYDYLINSCQYSSVMNNQKEPTNKFNKKQKRQTESEKNCVVSSLPLNDYYGLTSDRLFLLDSTILGLITTSDKSIRFFHIDSNKKTLTPMRTKFFRTEDRPYDACADSSKNIYIVFPDQNRIAKFAVTITGPLTGNAGPKSNNSPFNRQNKTNIIIKEAISIRDIDFAPTAISCNNDNIYVSQRLSKQIRVYDKVLRLVRVINLDDVVTSPHVSIDISPNVNLFLDGNDAISVFVPTNSLLGLKKNKKKYSLTAETNRGATCHFYQHMSCLKDMSVFTHNTHQSEIYIADLCDRNVKEFTYVKNQKIELTNEYALNGGTPTSTVKNIDGMLFVLMDNPRTIKIIDTKQCSQF